jgi:hypothetical protein
MKAVIWSIGLSSRRQRPFGPTCLTRNVPGNEGNA